MNNKRIESIDFNPGKEENVHSFGSLCEYVFLKKIQKSLESNLGYTAFQYLERNKKSKVENFEVDLVILEKDIIKYAFEVKSTINVNIPHTTYKIIEKQVMKIQETFGESVDIFRVYIGDFIKSEKKVTSVHNINLNFIQIQNLIEQNKKKYIRIDYNELFSRAKKEGLRREKFEIYRKEENLKKQYAKNRLFKVPEKLTNLVDFLQNKFSA